MAAMSDDETPKGIKPKLSWTTRITQADSEALMKWVQTASRQAANEMFQRALTPLYARGSLAPSHQMMPCVLPKPDYQTRVKNILGNDFERLTAQPVMLDDLCMFILEEAIAIRPHMEGDIKGLEAFGGRWTNTTLRTRYIALAVELAQISALILHYPETRLTYDLDCHVQLDWEALYWLSGVPLENTPSREALARLYVDTVIRDFDRLKVPR